MQKKYDLAIKTGEYTNSQGETKGRYSNIGAVMVGDDGGEFALLDPSVDLGGCLVLQNMLSEAKGQQKRSSVMCSMFAPQQSVQQPAQQPQQQAPQQQYQQQPQQQAPQQQQVPPNDNIPF